MSQHPGVEESTRAALSLHRPLHTMARACRLLAWSSGAGTLRRSFARPCQHVVLSRRHSRSTNGAMSARAGVFGPVIFQYTASVSGPRERFMRNLVQRAFVAHVGFALVVAAIVGEAYAGDIHGYRIGTIVESNKNECAGVPACLSTTSPGVTVSARGRKAERFACPTSHPNLWGRKPADRRSAPSDHRSAPEHVECIADELESVCDGRGGGDPCLLEEQLLWRHVRNPPT